MKFSVATLLALPLLAVATPTPQASGASCPASGGLGGLASALPIPLCCSQLLTTADPVVSILSALPAVGSIIGTVTGLVGIACAPLDGITGCASTATTGAACCADSLPILGSLLGLGCSSSPGLGLPLGL